MDKAKYTGPNTREMSLSEIIQIRTTRQLITKDIIAGRLKYLRTQDLNRACEDCGACVGLNNLQTLVYTKYDDAILCNECFEKHWSYIDPMKRYSNFGNKHVAMPNSENSYRGGGHHDW